MQFGRRFNARDSYDDEMNTKMQLMDDKGMTPFGQVYYDDKVGKWLERKAAVGEAANFDAYFNVNFNKNDLASRQWAQQIHPEFYKAREDEMNERAEIVLRLKKIQLRGPQDKQDLYMLWLIETGRVELPSNWDQIGPGFSDQHVSDAQTRVNEKQYRKGLIRMPLFRTESQRTTNAIGNAANRLWGNKENAVNTFPEGEPPAVFPKQNRPLAKLSDGSTLGSNFTNFLRQ